MYGWKKNCINYGLHCVKEKENKMSNSELIEQWTELKVLVESLELDLLKNASGNKSAGVRTRKGLRLLKQKSADLVKASLLEDKA